MLGDGIKDIERDLQNSNFIDLENSSELIINKIEMLLQIYVVTFLFLLIIFFYSNRMKFSIYFFRYKYNNWIIMSVNTENNCNNVE